MQIRIKKGLDIPLAGRPEQRIDSRQPVRSAALRGVDFPGLRPRLLVEVGDRVSLGQPLFVDKRDPDVAYTAPGGGRISAINRGARRSLQSVVVELAQDGNEETTAADWLPARPEAADPQTIRQALLRAGLWPAFRTRPYEKVPHSTDRPHTLFVTAIDTRPLAPSPELVVARHPDAFALGLRVLARLAERTLYLCTAPGWNGPLPIEAGAHAEFDGPHPAGLAGTHIHHLAPAGPGRTMWHIGYQDVIAIGKLFGEGRIWSERVVALGGSGCLKPRLLLTRAGAAVEDLLAGELDSSAGPLRRLSGSVLEGTNASGALAYLGRYDQQISVIRDQSRRRLFGWLGLYSYLGSQYSFAGRIARRWKHRRLHGMSTAQYGRPTAMVPVDAFERVLPMDILPVPLLRALLIGNSEEARALGCLELAPEDLALCSFLCPGKNDYGAALRMNLDVIEHESAEAARHAV
jgi:Na+-transporting NADH:ubiquinone oxidoreductase subunit A